MSWLFSRGLFGGGSATTPTTNSGRMGPGCNGALRFPFPVGDEPPRPSLHPQASVRRGARIRAPTNIVRSLIRRQQTGVPRAAGNIFVEGSAGVMRGLRDRLDDTFDGIPSLVLNLHMAMDRFVTQAKLQSTRGVAAIDNEWRTISDAVGVIAHKVLGDGPHGPHGAAHGHDGGQNEQLQKDRESFSMFGGPEALGRLFDVPMAPADARQLTADVISQRAEVYNDVLLILRELCFSVPELASRLASERLVLFLFTLLSQPAFFDQAVGLIEEILADQPQTFDLSRVPDLSNLLLAFSLRQLAHFCRVLALLVFEPEDRHLMESTRVLKSLEILQLRRDRMARGNSTIDRNQALLLGIPGVLDRLVVLLRTMNHGPALREMSSSTLMTHMHIPPYEVLVMLGGSMGDMREWDTIEQLEKMVDEEVSTSSPGDNSAAAPATGVGASAAAPSTQAPGTTPGAGVSVAELMTVLAPLLTSPTPPELNVRHIIQLVQAVQALNLEQGTGANAAAPIVMQRLHRRNPPVNAAEARNELQFNALLLTPHQVEVLFVLCTLLGGRRKIDVQRSLADLKLIPILTRMFDRLSWGFVAPEGPNPLERIHGPGCECNPESALRVQFLRLVHNFADRDSMTMQGSHKHLLLSEEERTRLSVWDPLSPSSEAHAVWPDPTCPEGLLTKICRVLMAEPADSVYRFWLASCVESFLRGSSAREQCFVAETGLLQHLLKEIISEGLKCAGSLQTAFDLLGELIKGNSRVLEQLDASLTDAQYRRLMDVVTSNLVDSNVFVRALLLTLSDQIDFGVEQQGLGGALLGEEQPVQEEEEEEEGSGVAVVSSRMSGATPLPCGSDERSYLLHSWWDVPPLCVTQAARAQKLEDVSSSTSNEGTGTMVTAAAASPLRRAAQQSEQCSIKDEEFSRLADRLSRLSTADALSTAPTHAVEASRPLGPRRLVDFLSRQHVRLLRDLMSVVDLAGVNHENICVLNTAIVLLIFSHRRRMLPRTLQRLRVVQRVAAEQRRKDPFSLRDASAGSDYLSTTFTAKQHPPQHAGHLHTHAQASPYGDEDDDEFQGLGRGCSCHPRDHRQGWSTGPDVDEAGPAASEQRIDFLKNFRALCWFHVEYYSHRGRDRLSLEFSSHIRFPEWQRVVGLLCADDGGATALVSKPAALPLSPYCLPPRRPKLRTVRHAESSEC